MNGLRNLDKTYQEYSLAHTDDLIRFLRSKVTVTAGCRGGEVIHGNAGALKSIFSFECWCQRGGLVWLCFRQQHFSRSSVHTPILTRSVESRGWCLQNIWRPFVLLSRCAIECCLIGKLVWHRNVWFRLVWLGTVTFYCVVLCLLWYVCWGMEMMNIILLRTTQSSCISCCHQGHVGC